MSDQASDDAFSSTFEMFNGVANRIAGVFTRRIDNIGDAPEGFQQTLAAIASAGGLGRLALISFLVAAATILVFVLIRAALKMLFPSPALLRRTHDLVWAFMGSLAVGLVVARLAAASPSPSRLTFSVVAVATALAAVVLSIQWLLIKALSSQLPEGPSRRARRFVRHLNFVFGFALAGAALLQVLRAWGANGGVRDMSAPSVSPCQRPLHSCP